MWLDAKANNEDTPNLHEATNGPHSEEFWRSMDSELGTLESIKAWSVVDKKQA